MNSLYFKISQLTFDTEELIIIHYKITYIFLGSMGY